MAASDYDFLETRNQIIAGAYRKIGALMNGETLSAEMLEQAVHALNEITNSWQAQKIFTWTLDLYTMSFDAASEDVPTATPFLGINEAWVRESTNLDTPLKVLSYRQYLNIPQKTDTGVPTHIAMDTDKLKLYVYPVPTAATTITILGVQRMQDWDSAAGAAGTNIRIQRALKYALAADLAFDYGIPSTERKDLEIMARSLKNEFLSGDTDNSESFLVGAY